MSDKEHNRPSPRAGLTIPEPSNTRDEGSLDLSGINIRPKPRVPADAVAAVSASSGFNTRMPRGSEPDSDYAAGTASSEAVLPAPRRKLKRSNRVHQFNTRLSREELTRIVDYCERHRVTYAEFLVAGLERLEADEDGSV